MSRVKIAVDLIRCGQEWDPSTGEQANYAVLGFGDDEVVVPVSEATLGAIVAHTQHSRVPDAPPIETLEKKWHEPVDPSTLGRSASLGHLPEDTHPPAPKVFSMEGGVTEGPVDDTPDELETSLFEDNDSVEVATPAERPAPKPHLTPQQIVQQRHTNTGVQRQRDLLEEKRQRARLHPAGKTSGIPADSAGNPLVPPAHTIRTVPASQALVQNPIGMEVEHRAPDSQLGGDDDGFGQG